MKYINMVLIFLFLGCGGGGAGESPTKISSNDLYVSEKYGDDFLGKGTSSKPFKTITKAINELNNSTNIYISGGKYNEENGEKFPINLPENLNILKSNENNFSVNIEGYGSTVEGKDVTIILNGGNKLNELTVSSLDNIAILSIGGNNKLISNTLFNNQNALGILNNSNVTLVNTLIKKNSHIGIELSNESTVKLLNTKVINSNIGLYISDNSMVDSYSKNSEILQNEECDFFTNGSQDIQLQGIMWDKDVFDFNIKQDCSNGNNIVNVGEGTISYQPLPNNLLFTDIENEILILSPKFSETIFSSTPIMKYTNTKVSKYVMVTLWKKIPIVYNGNLFNPEDIVWYWHTGMNKSPIGRIDYDKGATPINGDIKPVINNAISPKPLERGRAYYFAIWEWDNDGINIISSSSISYFIVAP